MKQKLWLLAFTLLLGAQILVVAGTDLILWKTADQGPEPIRALVLGDQDYYLLRVHATLEAGGPIESPFFLEHTSGNQRFVVFETFVSVAGKVFGFLGTNAVVWANLLRALAVTGLFLGLYYVFRKWAGIAPYPAMAFAFAINMWQEPFAQNSQYALGSWFIPIVLLGTIFAVHGLASHASIKKIGFLVVSLILFGVHPVSYFTACLAIALVLLAELYTTRSKELLGIAIGGGIFAVILGWSLFGVFLFPDGAHALIASDTLARNAAIDTHLPIKPLDIVRGLAVIMLLFITRKSAPQDKLMQAVWDFLLAWSVASFLGMNANLITGHYFLGDHFLFFERIPSVIAAACALSFAARKPTEKEWAAIMLALLGISTYGVFWLIGHAPRTWLIFGFAVPYFIANGVLAWVALGKPRLPLPHIRFSAVTASFLIGTSFLYGATFLWRLNRSLVPAHEEIQSIRPLIETLREVPKGVFVSNPELADSLALYTHHRPYWSRRAFQDEALQSELEKRWQDALVLFPLNASLADDRAKSSLYGTEGLFCGSFSERHLYLPLKDAGIISKSLCRQTLSPEAWTAFLKTNTESAEKVRLAGIWQPSYQLDYLVLDKAQEEKIPDKLKKNFELIKENESFAIYKYLK